MTRRKTIRDGGEIAQFGLPDETAAFASPPCFMHELDTSHLGYLSPSEVIDLLNRLLEGERAGARGVGELTRRASGVHTRWILREIARDEAHCCAMLTRHIGRLEGRASRATSPFYDKLLAAESLPAQLDLLDRGQRWVLRTLTAALPRIADGALRADLQQMLEVHQHNLEKGSLLEREPRDVPDDDDTRRKRSSRLREARRQPPEP